MIARACMTTVLMFFVPMLSWAWDEEPGVSAPKLVGSLPAQLNLTRIDVTLEGDQVSLRYQGSIRDRQLQPFVLSHYGQVFGWQGVAADYPDQHFPELSVRINGQLISPTPKVTALFEGNDISSDLRHAGLDPLRVAQGEKALIDMDASPKKSVRRFFSAGHGTAFPLWQLSYSRSWKLPRVSHDALTIQVDYLVRPAKTEVDTNSHQFAAAVLGHCGDVQQAKELIKDKQGTTPTSVVIKIIEIPLQLGNMAPADTFLKVTPKSKAVTASTLAASFACGPEESPLLGTPSIQTQKTATSTSLSVLEVFVQ